MSEENNHPPRGRFDSLAEWASKHRLILAVAFFVTVVGGAMLVADRFAPQPDEPISLTEILVYIESGDVESATVDENARTLTLVLESDDDGDVTEEVTAVYTGLWADTLTEALLDAEIETTVVAPSGFNPWTNALATFIPLILILGLAYFLIRSRLSKGSGRINDADVPDTRFSDIAGVDEAVEEMRELVQFVREGDKFAEMGARAPRGALFVGPPGTGKTLLARAVAGEAGIPFFEVTGSDFVEMFAGLGASRVRKLFKKAKEAGPSIIFIDEIDSVGRKRAPEAPGSGGASEMENTLTALLTEMDGFEKSNVIVIGATNRLDALDPALQRRLEHIIQVPLPDRRGRSLILQVHAKGKPFADDADWDSVGKQAFGMSGAELERVINEACMDAVRRGDKSVGTSHLLGALSTIQVGRERVSAALSARDKEIIAWHEAGHTIVCDVAESLPSPTFVTIVPRGGSGGHTRPGGSDDVFSTRTRMLDELAMLMGGRAAEIMLLGEGGYTQGAQGDLQSATRQVSAMLGEYGMGERLLQTHPDAVRVGGEVATRFESEADQLLREALTRAVKMLEDNRERLLHLVAELLERETLSSDELAEVLAWRPSKQGKFKREKASKS